jgi:hypothetical protein
MFAATGYDLIKSWQILQPSDLGPFGIGIFGDLCQRLYGGKSIALLHRQPRFVDLRRLLSVLFGLVALVYFWA